MKQAVQTTPFYEAIGCKCNRLRGYTNWQFFPPGGRKVQAVKPVRFLECLDCGRIIKEKEER